MMKQIKRTGLIIFLLSAVFLLVIGTVQAQTDDTGYINGSVYKDVDGDGNCINTGVEGEEPVEGITIEFVSSDEATVVTLTTADNGTYGLADAGESYWRVTAKPDETQYTVTSENPLYAPVFPADGLVQTGYDFCVSDGTITGGNGSTNAVIILPESGAAATNNGVVWLTAVFGLALIGIGIVLEMKRRTRG
ncbi:MAG: hypothetical protein GY805_31290 [Chloroflexi bacterium]|nr:hypothetical protein [Chloroflexota bacterium]